MRNSAQGIILLLVCGVFGDVIEEKSVYEGESVTLNTDTNILKKDKILWKLKENGSSNLLVEMFNYKITYDELIDGRFRDRLQISDTQTGDLTIKNMRIKYSGLYEAEIQTATGTSYKRFSVTVKESPLVNGSGPSDVKSVSVKEGESVTLHTDVQTQRGDLILWRFGDKNLLIAKGDMEDNKISVYDDDDGRFSGRLKLDESGNLTITNIRTSNAGVYNLKIISSRETKYKTFTVSLSVSGILWFQTITYVGLPFLILLLLTFLSKYLLKIQQKVWSRKTERHVFWPVLILLGLTLCLVVMLLLLGSDLILSFLTSNLHTTLVWTAVICLISMLFLILLLFLDFNNFKKKLICESTSLYNKVRNTVDNLYFLMLCVLLVLIGFGLIYFLLVVSASDKTLCNTEEMIIFLMALLVLFVACHILKITDDMKKCGGSTGQELNRRMGGESTEEDLNEQTGEQVMEILGDRVILKPDSSVEPGDKIEWRFKEEVIITAMHGNNISQYKGEDERFKDKLSLNNQNGTLIITRFEEQHKGFYTVNITDAEGKPRSQKMIFLHDKIKVAEGDSLTLPGAKKKLLIGTKIEWKFNNRVITTGNMRQDAAIIQINGVDQQFNGRLVQDPFRGSLIINDISKNDIGLYEVNITNKNETSHNRFHVDVIAKEPTARDPMLNV